MPSSAVVENSQVPVIIKMSGVVVESQTVQTIKCVVISLFKPFIKPTQSTTMISSQLYIFSLLAVISSTHAAIGPVTNLVISNANIAPDGFTRPYVNHIPTGSTADPGMILALFSLEGPIQEL